MRVAHLTSVHPCFDTRIFHKQVKTLAKAGYNVTLIAQHRKNETINGIKIIALPRPKNRFQRVFGLTFRVLILAIKQKADIYHFHDPELIPAGIVLKILGKRVIYDVHEDYGKSILLSYYLPKYIRGVIATTVDLIERFASKYFNNIIAATDNILEKFSYHKGATVIHNFPILSKFIEETENSVNDSDTFNLIYVGGLAEERGITEMVQSLEYLNSPKKNIKLILCGDFSPRSYEEKVKVLKGFEKVEYPGWIKPEDAWLRMTQADAGIVCFHPEENHINAMPNKLFEYMAAGLPVIASNFPLWKRIVEDNKCGICVDPLKPEEISKAIEYLVEHIEIRREMGKNGNRIVLEKYNWEKECMKLLQIYEGMVKGAK